MSDKKDLFGEDSEGREQPGEIPTQNGQDQDAGDPAARSSKGDDPTTEGGGGKGEEAKSEKKPPATPGRSKARTMSAAEFIRKSRAKQRGGKKEPPIEITPQVIRVAKKTETQLDWAFKNKNYMHEKVTIHIKTTLQQLLYLGTENFLWVMKEVAGKEPVAECLPNTVRMIATALEQSNGAPWKQMVDLMSELNGEERKLIGQGLLIAASRWKEACALWVEPGRDVVRWLNAVITQLHEKCLIAGGSTVRTESYWFRNCFSSLTYPLLCFHFYRTFFLNTFSPSYPSPSTLFLLTFLAPIG